jgi:hypothetical protein
VVVVGATRTVDADGEAVLGRIAVGIGDPDGEVELLVGRRLRLRQAEAADIEGVVVVARNAVCVADVFLALASWCARRGSLHRIGKSRSEAVPGPRG